MGERKQGAQTGAENPMWKGGRSLASNGYVLIRVGIDHHLSDVRGYAYEHRLVAEEKLGRPLAPDEQVHHINGNKQDNRPENLEVCSDIANHRARHRTEGSTLRLPGQENPTIECACGCGASFPEFDDFGRPRDYLPGHSSKFQPSPTIDHILGKLESGPKTTGELANGFNGTKKAIKSACAKLAKEGVIVRLRRGVYAQKH